MAPDAGRLSPSEDDEAAAKPAAPSGIAGRLLEALPAEVRDGFTERQRGAIMKAAEVCSWKRHPADLRVSIPLFKRRYYLIFLAGQERRSKERLRKEHRHHPLATGGNLLLLSFLGICATFFGGFLFTLIFVLYLSL